MTIKSNQKMDASQPASRPRVKHYKSLYYGTPRRAAKTTANPAVPVARARFLDVATSAVTFPGDRGSSEAEGDTLERVRPTEQVDVRVTGTELKEAEQVDMEKVGIVGYRTVAERYRRANQDWPNEPTLLHIPEGPPADPRALRRQGAMQTIPGHGRRGTLYRWLYPFIKFLRISTSSMLLFALSLLLKGLSLLLGFIYDHRVSMTLLWGMCILFQDFLWD